MTKLNFHKNYSSSKSTSYSNKKAKPNRARKRYNKYKLHLLVGILIAVFRSRLKILLRSSQCLSI